MHVLLLESDSTLADIYTQAFEAAGWTTTVAPRAQQAMIAIDTRMPDVVVMDLQLAGANGVAFLQEFRSYADLREVPVIVQTMQRPAAFLKTKALLQRDFSIVTWLYKPQTTLAQLIDTVRIHAKRPPEGAA